VGAHRIYRIWPAYRKGLVEFDGAKTFFSFLWVDVLCAAMFWLPPVARAAHVPPLTATALVLTHIVCVYLNGFPLYRLAQRARWAFHVQVATAVIYNMGICLAFISVSHSPQTLMWMTTMIYAGVCGASQEIEPSWAFLFTFLFAPLLTIPWFLHVGASRSWAIGGPVLAAAFDAALYHTLAIASAGWREERRRMSARLAELERRAIARDIHDGVGSSLALMGICGDALEQTLGQPEAARPILRTLQETARSSLVELREVLDAIAPGATDLATLGATLDRFGNSASVLTGARVAIEIEGDGKTQLGSETRQAVTRVFQEALSNALRHGGARVITARLRAAGGHVSLEIADDGAGFSPSDRRVGGRGIAGMQARVRELGGTFELSSRPGAGTRLAARVPVSAAA
jgi:signal transduction histidine kinase